MPSAVAALHQKLNLPRSPAFSARRERSSTKLDASRMAVLRKRIGGECTPVQSSMSERPRRTTKALGKAPKATGLGRSKTKRRVKEAARLAPRPAPPPASPPPHPVPMGGGGPCKMSCVKEAGIAI